MPEQASRRATNVQDGGTWRQIEPGRMFSRYKQCRSTAHSLTACRMDTARESEPPQRIFAPIPSLRSSQLTVTVKATSQPEHSCSLAVGRKKPDSRSTIHSPFVRANSRSATKQKAM